MFTVDEANCNDTDIPGVTTRLPKDNFLLELPVQLLIITRRTFRKED